MRYTRALLVLAAWSLLTSAAQAADAPNCGLKRFTSLSMSTLSDGRIAVPVAVDGHAASFLVDTGGISATMSRQLATDIGKEPMRFRRGLIGVGGARLSSSIHADDFALGPMHGKDILVFIDERIGGAGGMDGTLAPEMMHRFDVDYDFRHGAVNFFSQDHCPGKVVYWTKDGADIIPMDVDPNGKIRIPVTVDGNKVMAILDTGSVTSYISMGLAHKLGIADSKDLTLKRSYGYKGQFKEYDYPFKTLTLEGLTVKNPHIKIMSNAALNGFGEDLTLGISFLRQLHLYVAYKEEKLYVTPAAAE